MRFQTGHAEVQTEGFGESAHFSIAASGKAFKGLIDGLYSRKIEAVIRELATNAFDAHKAAGSIAPFDMRLPTTLDPVFYIRDYGTGMSHDLMMRRYTTLFDSTKDGLNEEDNAVAPDDQVGMLGLGSKSFFSYTDSCTISVWQEGEVRHYTVYMGDNGIPQIALAGRAPSSEPVGVKVQFAVQTKDVKEFETAAIRVLKGFPVVPAGLPDRVEKSIRVEPSQVGSFWRAYPDDYLEGHVFWAKQGCVLYPIDLGQIDSRSVEVEEEKWDHNVQKHVTHKSVKLSQTFAQFGEMKATMIIDFPIGSLEFDLGRERLAYTDRTVNALRKRWDDMINDVANEVEQEFDGAATPWERLQRSGRPALTALGLLYEQTDQYREVTGRFKQVHELLAPTRADRCSLYPLFAVLVTEGEAEVDGDIVAPARQSVIYHRNEYRADAFFNHGPTPALEDSIVVFRDIKTTRANQRIFHYMETHGHHAAFVIEKGDLKPSVFKTMGRPNILRISDLPEPPKVPKTAKKKTTVQGSYHGFDRIKVMASDYNYRAAENENEYEGHLFAFMNCGSIHNPDPDRYPDINMMEVMAQHRVLQMFGHPGIAFINVRKNEFDKLDRWDDFPLFYGCLDNLNEMVSDRDVTDMVNIINFERFSGTFYDSVMDDWFTALPNASDPISQLRRFERRNNRVECGRRGKLVRAMRDVSELEEIAIARGIALGLEVLPPFLYNKFPYPLLPNKWERLARMVNKLHVWGNDRKTEKFTYLAMKESLGC